MNVYFNVNANTLIMWSSTVLGMILLYEAVRYQLRLCMERRLRPSAALLLSASIYPHYYAWWMYFNAFNEDFFRQFYHQVWHQSIQSRSLILASYYRANTRDVRPRGLASVSRPNSTGLGLGLGFGLLGLGLGLGLEMSGLVNIPGKYQLSPLLQTKYQTTQVIYTCGAQANSAFRPSGVGK